MDTSREAGLKVGGNGFGRHFRAARLHWPALAIACLVPLAGYNYLLFHTVVEFASIIVACGVFVIAWNAYPFSRNRFLLFLGTGLLWVSGLDLFHTLVYRGMNLVPGIEGGNAPTQFWIGTRYLHAAILLAAPLFIAWPLKRWWAMSGLGAATGAMFLWLLSGTFPDAYLEGSGLTPFKIYSEYAIVAALGGAIAFLWRRRQALDERIYLFVMASTVLLMAGELAFTKYVSVYGPANLVGHLFKVLAYWLIYVALVDRALAQPFRIMARAASTYDAIPDATVVVDREGVIHQVNEAARQVTGLPGMEALGRDCHALFHVESAPREACAACVAIREGKSAGPLELEDAAAGRWIEVSLAPVARGEEVSGLVHVSRDITSRKNATELVRREQAHLTAVLETLPVGVWITDPTGRIVQGNPAGREVWGGAHYVGIDRFDEYKGWWSDSGKRIAAEDWAVARAIRSGESAFGELIDIEGFDGKRRTILNSAVPLRGAKGEIEGVVVVNQDVTERREAERERERLFRDLVERMKELACMYAISDVLERRGDDLGDVLHEIAALLPPAFQFPDLAVARVAVGELEGTSTGFRRTPWRTSEDVVASGECVGIVEVCYREEPPGTGTGPFLEEEHKLVDVVAERMGRLVERLEAKKRVESLSRLYATLGQTNQAIIHVTEPQPLFHEICRLACENGGFATAWIGMEGPGGEGFAVVASRGLDEAEIVQLGQAAANPDGNVSRVLRTGQRRVTNDCGRDPEAGCWLVQTDVKDVGGCAILPLRTDGKVIGVLGLHASATGRFDAAQLALLDEMANDISFALDNIERESRRKLGEQALVASEERFRRVRDAAQDGIVVIDHEGRITDWNPAAERIFGYSQEEAIGHDAHALLAPPRYRDEFERGMREFVANGKGPVIGSTLVVQGLRRDGSEVPVEISIAALRWNDRWNAVASIRDITERVQAQRRIGESEARLNEAQRIARVGNWELDLVTGKLSWSDEIFRIFEVDPAKFGASYEAFLEGIHPDDRALVDRAYTESLRTRTPYDIVHRLRMADGRVKYVNERCETAFDETGKPLRSIGTVQDITERVRAQEAELEQLRLSESFFNQSVSCVAILDRDFNFVRVNEAYARAGKRKVEDFAGRNHFGMYPSDAKAIFEEVVRTKRPFETTGRPFAYADQPERGTTYWDWALVPILDAQGEVRHLVYTLHEVTERTLAQEKQRAAALYARSLIEASLDPLVTISPEGKVMDVNRMTEEATGLTRKELVGTDFADYFTEPEQARAGYRLVLEHGLVRDYPLAIRHRDGHVTEVLYNASVYRNEAGELQGVFAAARDITERKRAESALREREEYIALLVQKSPLAMVVASGEEQRAELVNEKFTSTFGYAIEDMPDVAHWWSLAYPDEAYREAIRERWGRMVATAIAGKGEIEPMEADVRCKDGTVRHIEFRFSSIGTRHLITFVDLTERKRAEVALKRLNRSLETLSRCNEALVHATVEPALLDAMCRIIVEVGGYRLAWVGFAKDEPSCPTVIAAKAGEGRGYLSQIAISWSEDEPGGRGPSGKAIRQGELQVVNDTMRDPDFAPWRDAAERSGIASVLALPLLPGDGVRRAEGVLAIYGAEAGAFDEQEIALLAELASDLSYGILTLRGRLDRQRTHEQLEQSLGNAIRSIAMALEKRDPYTAGHQRRVAELSEAIGREMGLSEDVLLGLHLAATIHDIGKIYVPAEILARPGKLSAVEFELIKTHPKVGFEIMASIDFPWPVAEAIVQHHERLDGSGYPYGLKGDAICLEGRILAVADVVEAMASHRPYRPALGIEAALAEILAKRGSQFDERAVDACVAVVRQGRFAWSPE